MSYSKGVLAERLAHWLNRVLAAGRAKPGTASEEDINDDECIHDSSRQRKQFLVEHTQHPGEVPSDVEVTAEQAESALGRTMATEMDVEISEAADAYTKEEDEALAGHQVNPNGVGYSCLSWQHEAPSTASAQKPAPAASSSNQMKPAPSSASVAAAVAKAPDGDSVPASRLEFRLVSSWAEVK